MSEIVNGINIVTKNRRLRVVVCSAFVVALISASMAFAIAAPQEVMPISADIGGAGGNSLKLVESSPANGATDLQPQNVGIKLYFDGNVTGDSVKAANAKCLKFTHKTENGVEELPVKAYSLEEVNSKYILAIVETKDLNNNSLANNEKYQLTVSGDLASTDGKTLGADQVIDFNTVDQSSNTTIYMLLMVGMIGAMIFMTIFQNRRKEKAAAEVAAKAGKVNPYKFAKEKKITVAEAMDLIEKDRQRRLKRLGLSEGKDESAATAAAMKPRETKKVKAPRPISVAGSTYKTGRSALIEKRAQETLEKFEKAQAAKRNPNQKKARSKSKRKSRKR